MRKSLLIKMLPVILVVLSAPAGWLGWRYYTSRPTYILRNAQAAVSMGKDAEAKRWARLLEEKGKPAMARLVRGWMLLRHARQKAKEQTAAPAYFNLAQIAGRLIAAGAVVNGEPTLARGVTWTTASLLPVPALRPKRGNADFVRALDEFTRIQDDGRIGDEATVRAAECLLQLGARRFAGEALTDLVERRPNVTEAHRWLAAMYIDLNSPDQALPHLRAWARLDPKDGRPERWIGYFIRDDRQYDEAVAAYREALSRQLDDRVRDEVRQELADTLGQYLHDYQQALDVLDQGSEHFRETPDSLALRARCLSNLNRNSEADAVVDRALQRYPHNQQLLLLRGELSLQKDDAQAAIAPLRAAAALDPYDVRTRQQLAEAYQLAGKTDLANRERQEEEVVHHALEQLGDLFTQAKARPWDGEVRYQMGVQCMKVHQFDKASTWLRAALACDPENSAAQLALAQLGAMQGKSPPPASADMP